MSLLQNSAAMTKRIYIGKCPVDCITLEETVEKLLRARENGKSLLTAPVNAATVVHAERISEFKRALDVMDILIPDGHWIQYGARLARQATTHHVATVRLVYRLLEELCPRRGRIFLLGAEEKVLVAAAKELIKRFPGIQVAGARNGYFSDKEEDGIVEEINRSHSDLLLIGISSPKREYFMFRQRDRLAVSAVIGVGGMLDILGGKTAEGPDWLRDYGLMWIYRFIQDPRRMWIRYSVTNLRFIRILLKNAIGIC
jgi:N-acetylglucosaminyldiphosphoundecaprenol N-acetyl-beta-D-mannosaminyltransferase